MKLQFKSILAAVALVAVAGSASAAAMPITTAATGSSLLFYAFDDVTKTSYVQDLGLTFSSFLPASVAAGTPSVTAISSNTGWNDYLASVSGDTSNTYWGVVAGLTANAGNPGFGLISTIRNGDSAVGQTAANAKSAVGGSLKNAFLGINGATSTASTGYFSDSAAGDNIANNFGHNGAGKLVFNTDNLIGATSAIQYGNSSVASFPTTTYAAAYTFDGSNLVLAVPEPSSYAMMLGGLMLVGGVAARRRKSSK